MVFYTWYANAFINRKIKIYISSFKLLNLRTWNYILAIIIVKYFKFKQDHLNLLFKFGIRVIFYLFIFLTGNKWILFFGIIYLLITDCTHNFIFSSYFINEIKKEHSLTLTTLKYCASLIGSSIGVFFCGISFQKEIKYFIIPTLIFGLIHYLLATILVYKKQNFKMKKVSN